MHAKQLILMTLKQQTYPKTRGCSKNGNLKKKVEEYKSHQRIWNPHMGVVHPFCSQPPVGRLVGLKPVVGDHRIGFSPDNQKLGTEL